MSVEDGTEDGVFQGIQGWSRQKIDTAIYIAREMGYCARTVNIRTANGIVPCLNIISIEEKQSFEKYWAEFERRTQPKPETEYA